jgi:hypothetical protein
MNKDAKPLYEFSYGESKVDTYGTYSIINSNEGKTIYENIIYIKNNKVEIIDQNLDRNIYGIIIDEYNDKEVSTVLLKNHKIFNIKDKMLTPKEFNTDKIVYMSNNINTDSGYVVVMYENGRVVVFDYRTGKEITNEKITKKISFLEYAQDNIDSYTNLGIIEEDSISYKDAEILKQNLKNNNIVKDNSGRYVLEDNKEGSNSKDNPENSNDNNNNKSTKTNYITFYNNISNSYEVIDVNKVLEENDPVSETDKINGTPDLISFFNTNKDTKSNVSVNILYIFGFIVFGIAIFLIIWLKNVKLVMKEKKR